MRNTAFYFDAAERAVESHAVKVQNAIENPWLPVMAVAVFGLSVLTYSIGKSNVWQKDTVTESVASRDTGPLKTEDIEKLSQLFGLTPPRPMKFYEEMSQPSEHSAPSVFVVRKVANESQ